MEKEKEKAKKDNLRKRRNSDVFENISLSPTSISSLPELPSILEETDTPLTPGQKHLRKLGYKNLDYFEGTPPHPPTPLSPLSPKKPKLFSEPSAPNPNFFRRHWRLILGTVLAALLLIIAFTPIGHALACLIVAKSFISPLCEALMQSCLNTQITVGISAVLIGYALPFINYLFFIPLWCVGMTLKATAKIAKGCLFALSWILFECKESSNAVLNFFIILGKALLGTLLALGLLLFTLIANIGDKLFRRPAAPHVFDAWKHMTHIPIPTPTPRPEIDLYKFNPDIPVQDYPLAVVQDLKHMAHDVFQVSQNLDDHHSNKLSP